jgi:hypothetical protein
LEKLGQDRSARFLGENILSDLNFYNFNNCGSAIELPHQLQNFKIQCWWATKLRVSTMATAFD